MFPFIVKFRKKLSPDYDQIENEVILGTLRKGLKHGGAKVTSIKNNSILKFEKLSTKSGPMQRLIFLDCQIRMNMNRDQREILYVSNTSFYWLFGLFIGAAAGIGFKDLSYGLIAFVVLGFGNWAWVLIYQSVFFFELCEKALRDCKNGL